jgi:hypothetical protein
LLSKQALKTIVHRPDLTQTQQLLLCLAHEVNKPKSVSEILSIAREVGLPKAQKWNVSSRLREYQGQAIRTPSGWELTPSGVATVRKLAGNVFTLPQLSLAISLRARVANVQDLEIKRFIEEAITCLELKLYRAAVVLSWVGAVAVLYEHVLKNKLFEFNAEMKKRDSKWKEAKTRDDLSTAKEKTFLEALDSISLIGKNVRQELEECLRLRNSCGHPNSLEVAEHRVASHIELLILNVFARFTASQ